jgi:protein SEY1
MPAYFRAIVRTVLLFVIRDNFATPVVNLERRITGNLAKLWESLFKPERLQGRQFTDYFKLVFDSLPHKFLAAADFDTQIKTLRQRFVDPKDPNYLFHPTHPKKIPAKQIAFHMGYIWVSTSLSSDFCAEVFTAATGVHKQGT